jgi:hypothetical protein
MDTIHTRYRTRTLVAAVVLAASALVPLAAQSAAQTAVESAADTAAVPVTMAFLGFASSEIGPSGLAILADLVKKEISLAPGMALVSRDDMGAILDEQELSASGTIDPAKAVKAGKILGARKLMAGSIGKLGSLFIISVRLVDAETGETERVVTREFVGPLEDLRTPVRIAAQQILGIPGIDVKQGEYISIESEPAGISVYVDGLFEGSTPLLHPVSKAGSYAVKLQSEGYKAWSQNVKVAASSTYFVKAKLLKQDKPVDERVRALQDGRAGLLTFLTLYSAVASDALLIAFGLDVTDESFLRLSIGLPLVVAPVTFFSALKLTERIVMNSGRSLFICTSMLWGSSWGPVAAIVFSASGQGLDMWPLYSGLSVLGGTLYGTITTLLTRGPEPYPAARAWLFNLGSALGGFLGLGLPYVLGGGDTPWIIYTGMITGSLAGSGIALWLTRDLVEGRSIGNLAMGSLFDLRDGVAVAGLPLPRPKLSPSTGERIGWELDVISARY